MTTNTDVRQLLPCPFCGAEPVKIHHEPHDHPILKSMGIDWPDRQSSFTVECPRCGVGMIHESEAILTDTWNRRAALSAPERETVRVPRELVVRAIEATRRHKEGFAPMRIPANLCDSDVVHAELSKLIAAAEGKAHG